MPDAVALIGQMNASIGGDQEPQTGSMSSNGSHWSITVLEIGALISLISAVSTGIMTMYPLCTTFGALCLFDLIGIHYLKKFVPLKDLEGSLASLASRVKNLAKRNVELEKTNKELDGIAIRLGEQQRAANTALAEAQSRFAIQTKVLDDTSAKLLIVEAHLKALNATQAKMGVEADAMAATVQQYLSANGLLQSGVEGVGRSSSSLRDASANIHNAISSLGRQQNQRKEKVKQFNGFVEALQEKAKRVKEIHEEAIRQREELQKEFKDIRTIESRLREDLKQLSEHPQNWGDVIQALNKATTRNMELSKLVGKLLARIGYSAN